jgi:hypothetical protein
MPAYSPLRYKSAPEGMVSISVVLAQLERRTEIARINESVFEVVETIFMVLNVGYENSFSIIIPI